MKKLASLFLSAALGFSLVGSAVASADSSTLIGDVNRDGKITIEDTMAILRYVVNGIDGDSEAVAAADLDGSGDITIADALLSLQYFVEGRTELPSEETHTNDFDLERGVVMLNNGIEMPILGIGTFTLTSEQASDSVYWAMQSGFRLIDTASAYGNEDGVGQGLTRAIDEGIVKREDVFVTTKLWPNNYNDAGIDMALENLGLDYIDLILLHQPMGDYIEGYQALERAVAAGKVRSIGLSNFSQSRFREIVEIAEIMPAVLQVETHPFYQQTSMIDFIDQYGTVIEAWFPLGGRGHTQDLFGNETIMAIAEAHGKSSAQIILRWHLQAGHIAIPGSNNPDHIQEDFEIFDFELTDEEMERMTALDTGAPYFGGFSDDDAMDDASDRWGLNT